MVMDIPLETGHDQFVVEQVLQLTSWNTPAFLRFSDMRQMALVTILCFGHTTGSNQLEQPIASSAFTNALRISNLRLGVLNPRNAMPSTMIPIPIPSLLISP